MTVQFSSKSYPAARMLNRFDEVFRRVQHVLVARYGKPHTATLLQNARREYEQIIPRLPEVGGKQNPFLGNLVGSGWFLALYRALKAEGVGLAEIGKVVEELYIAWLDSYPRLGLYLLGWWRSRPTYIQRLKRQGEFSQQRMFAGNWVYSAYEGKSEEPAWDVEYPEYDQRFDWAVDFKECAICKLYRAEGAAELVPFLCRLDLIMADRLGWKLERSMTLGDGAMYCSFRFSRRNVLEVPRTLQSMGVGMGLVALMLVAGRALFKPRTDG